MRSGLRARWILAAAYSALGLAPAARPAALDGPDSSVATAVILSLQENPRPVAPAAGTAPAATAAQKAPAASSAGQLSLEERADIYMARKSYADAVEYYTRALKQKGSSSATLWNKLGIAYQQQVRYRPARRAYNEAIRRRKDFAEPWNNLGTLYYLQNNFRKSLKYYQEAIRLSPASASFHLNIGTSYYHLKRIKEAIDEYRRALELDPNCLTERSSTGTIIQARGADVEFYYYLAKVFASLGRTEDAVRYLRRAFEDGLEDVKRVNNDPDFQKISQEPAYLELIKNPPVPIKD